MVLGGCWEVVGKVIGSRRKWWSGAEMGESRVAGGGGKNGVLGGCWEVVGKVIGSRRKWWSGAEMGESGVAGGGGKNG
nr:hypothetical protein [Tanacetum cinerariifolium]